MSTRASKRRLPDEESPLVSHSKRRRAENSDGDSSRATSSTPRKPKRKKRTRAIPVTDSHHTRNESKHVTVASPRAEQAALLEESSTSAPTTLSHDTETRQPEAEDLKALEVHQSLISKLERELVCEICLDWLYKPYTLVPCGHVSCYGCLNRWFTTSPDDEPLPNQVVLNRPKMCPHCRSTVLVRPIETWTIKNMVSILSASGLGITPSQEMPQQPSGDPWAGIFPLLPNGRDPPPALDDASRGIIDAEDGVFRCWSCHHEIVDGVCSGCWRQYETNDLDYDSDDDDDYFPLAVHPFLGPFLYSSPPRPIRYQWEGDNSEEEAAEEEHTEGEEEEYESSFIDDQESRAIHLHDSDVESALGFGSQSEAISEASWDSDDSSESSGDDEVEVVAPSKRSRPRLVLLSDEESDSAAEDAE